MEEEIKIINDIIAISVEHGGDLGGPYYTMPKKLCKIITEYLCFKNLQNDYHLIGNKEFDNQVPMIVPISEEPDKNWYYDYKVYNEYEAITTEDNNKKFDLEYESSDQIEDEINNMIDLLSTKSINERE